jgi:hypothetical protein
MKEFIERLTNYRNKGYQIAPKQSAEFCDICGKQKASLNKSKKISRRLTPISAETICEILRHLRETKSIPQQDKKKSSKRTKKSPAD